MPARERLRHASSGPARRQTSRHANIVPVRPNPLCTSSMISTMPWRVASVAQLVQERRPARTTKPPSPSTGSTMIAARSSGRDQRLAAPARPIRRRPGRDTCTGTAAGRSPARMGRSPPCTARPCRSGSAPSSVRPWKPCSKQSTAPRFVQPRAIFTAFSTASAPVETSSARFSKSPGVMPHERFGHLDVGLVAHHLEADVREARRLLGDRLDDRRLARDRRS